MTHCEKSDVTTSICKIHTVMNRKKTVDRVRMQNATSKTTKCVLKWSNVQVNEMNGAYRKRCENIEHWNYCVKMGKTVQKINCQNE